jgi:hypothetical protein
MMGAVASLEALLDERRIWKGRPAAQPVAAQPTGHALLDAALPMGGWPPSALSEILIPADGSGELRLLWPTLARLADSGERIVLVAPPYVPYPQAWQAAGIDLQQLAVIDANERDCGPWSNACAPAVAGRCCAGRKRSMTGPCVGCKWRPKPERPWPSPAVRNRPLPTRRLRRCVWRSTCARRNCVCSNAGAVWCRRPPFPS